MDDGDKQFISEEVIKILEDAVNNLFGIRQDQLQREINVIYVKEKANANINHLIDFVIRRLCQLNKPFKYCVTGLHMQNNGAGLNSCGNNVLTIAVAYNDLNTDGAVTIQKQIGDNIIVLTVFAMQI